MDLAIVAPSPVPFMVGGAERLWSSLAVFVNAETRHRAELIKLPVDEGDLPGLVAAYRAFSRLDLAHFDLVVSGKYPAWMVPHPNHLVYLLHTLRGLYDHYPFGPGAEPPLPDLPAVAGLLRFLGEQRGGRTALEPCLDLLAALPWSELPPESWAVCSPLSRAVVHWFDRIGLDPAGKSRLAAISATVADRYRGLVAPARFEVVHPASPLAGTPRCGQFEYLFTASRLDRPKRLDLVIAAMRRVRADVELRIAGSGPELERLRELAAGDDRVRFVGFCSDSELRALYADALAVPFVPFDEDLGLVTVEAMQSGKPVITATDSGGPLEFVRDGVDGLVVEPTAEALAAAIDRLCRDRGEAERLGAAGRRAVAGVTWERAFDRLIGGLEPAPRGRERRASWSPGPRRLAVATTFPIHPPLNGGQCRVYHLLRNLADHHLSIDVVTLGSSAEPGFDGAIAPGVREIRIPKTAAHEEAEAELSRTAGSVPVTDVALALLHGQTPGYAEALGACVAGAEIVVACHPFPLPVLRECPRRPLWYEAQDVEVDLKRRLFAGARADCLLASVREVEEACCLEAEVVTVCADEDGRRLRELFGVAASKLAIVPNGVDPAAVRFVSARERRAAQRLAGVAGRFTCVFVGSHHGPNLEAVETILGLAAELPDVDFVVVGSSCWPFQERELPANAALLGVVDEAAKAALLGLGDLALNPVGYGSGTNLKMLEYCAAGIPVLSTPAGNRGLDLLAGLHLTEAEPAEFAAAIDRLRRRPAYLAERAERARSFVEVHYAWQAIADRFYRSNLRYL